MKTQRRRHNAEFNAKVALEAIQGPRTTNEIAAAYGIHPVLLSQWKKQVQEELPQVFSSQRAKAALEEEALRDRLYHSGASLSADRATPGGVGLAEGKVGPTR